MTPAEVSELFIRAAIIDRRLPIQARPAKLKASWIPFVHTEEDVKSRIRTGISFGDFKEHLHPDDNPFEEWVQKWWDEESQRLKPDDIAAWEKANELIALVADEGNRKALWAWAAAKVGSLETVQSKTRTTKAGPNKTLGKQKLKLHKRVKKDVSFAAWCRANGIHEETGRRRKGRAIAVISQQLVRSTSSNAESGPIMVLPVGDILEHIADNIAAPAGNEIKPTTMRLDGAFQPVGHEGFRDFSWAQARSEARRQRYEQRKKREAA